MVDNLRNTKSNKLFYSDIDWPFLLFIIGVLNVKTYIKVVALLLYFAYLIYRKMAKRASVTWPLKFYLLMPVIGVLSPLLNNSFSHQGYWFGYLFGLLQWIVCAAAFYILYIAVKTIPKEKLIKTVEAFFAINIIVTLYQLIVIMIAAHNVMPYWLYDEAGRFGVSTGDHLYGIYGNNAITNSSISIIGGIYFLCNNKMKLALLNFLIMLFTTSNLSLVISLCALLLIILFKKGNRVKIKSSLIAGILLILYPFLSPGNMLYIRTIYKTFILHVATNYENPDKLQVLGSTKPAAVIKDSLNALPEVILPPIKMDYKVSVNEKGGGYVDKLKELKYLSDKSKTQNSNVTLDQNQLKHSFLRLYGIPVERAPLTIYSKPGKVYAIKQTGYFLMSDVKNFFFGAGMGNFSSKLAIRMTGLELQGKYPKKYVYASRPFVEYHLYELFYYLCQNVALHSIVNLPYSTYNQIAGEYGLAGLILFLIFYIGFFWKTRNKSGYGRFLILILLLFFNVDYWFEMASLTIIFELLMLMDIFVYTNADTDKSSGSNSLDAGI